MIAKKPVGMLVVGMWIAGVVLSIAIWVGMYYVAAGRIGTFWD